MADKKKKILIFHPALAPYRVDYFNALTEKYDVVLALSKSNASSQKFDQEKLRGMLLCSSFVFKPLLFWRKRPVYFGKTLRCISKNRPDIIICSEFSPILLEVLIFKTIKLLKNIPIITIIDDSPAMVRCKFNSFIKRNIRGWALRHLNGLIVLSDEVKKLYANYGMNTSKIAVSPLIQNEIEFKKQLIAALPIANDYAKQYSLGNKKILLYVGRFTAVKNQIALIEAFSEMESMQNTVLVMIGEGELYMELTELARERSKNILCPGRFEGVDLLAWYLLGQCFILPSISEVFGAVVNEALIAGIPCIISELAGAASLISTAEQGRVFDPYDKNALKECIKEKLSGIKVFDGNKIGLRDSLMPMMFKDSVVQSIQLISDLIEENNSF